MSPSSQQTTIIAWVAAVAVAATVRSTVAAPQSDGGEPVLTIGGQRCTCVVFYMCLANDTISPSSSTEQGCTDELICCRLQNDSPLPPVVTESVVTSTELPQISLPPQEPYIENNKPCTCVSRNQCIPSNGNDGRQNSNTRADSCESNKVCCINEYVNIVSTQETHVDGGFDNNNNERSCGIGGSPPNTLNSETTATRITNPKDHSNTYKGQFPWMAAILKTDKNEETGVTTENVLVCGGSLIHPRVILTAAHCVKGLNVNTMKVRIGTQSIDNKESKTTEMQYRGISKITYHPQHNNGTMFNDIALIDLESEIILNQHINIICIPGSDEKQTNYDSQACVSTGWGKDGFKKESQLQSMLKKVDLSLVPNDLCQQKLRKTRLGNYFNLHESFICAGGIKGEDVCQGDGGGPLICAMKGQSKKYIQVGIVSWGIGCGDENIPGVYSSLVANSKWIHKTLKTIIS